MSALAQVTTSSISGKVSSNGSEVIGATVTATHTASGTVYRGVTNYEGNYAIASMKAGGPYTIEFSYIGCETQTYTEVNLQLGMNTVIDADLKEGSELVQEVIVSGSRNSKMSISRSGAVTSVGAAQIASVPTVSRSMNDILKLTPQGGNTGNGFAVGGGNYRQSYVTVDGAAFNNAFGIGSNLPANGSPISLDAIDQISVSVTPFDVRQSGFTGGAISAVTKSGTNEFKGSAYVYTTNAHLNGNKVGDAELSRTSSHTTTYGVTLGGPIIKDKLFFFVNGEYEDQSSAGPTGIARTSESDTWSSSGQVHRPVASQMETISSYLQSTYGYNPGRYQQYALDTPAYKILARLDWNINDNNKINVRFSRSHTKDSNSPSSSTSPLANSTIYPGGTDGSAGRSSSGRTANTALYFESSRYYQEMNFTTLAGEWNSKWKAKKTDINNTLRFTYSYQDEPRAYEGGVFPTVDILENGSCYTSFGPDPFTEGNLRQVKTFVVTDEVTFSIGKNNIMAGAQFETNKATNGYAQGANGYYVYSSWDDFVNGNAPSAYAITFAMDGSDQFLAEMKYNQLSFYVQDQVNFSERFRLTAGLRFELPMYPSLDNNYNEAFADLVFRHGREEVSYSTDQLPGTKLTVSPRVGFNWDITGEKKYVLRGGLGYFIGRLPFVWLVSAVGNSGVGQYTYYYNTVSSATGPTMQSFIVDKSEQIAYLQANGLSASTSAPSSPTIIDKDLKMNGMLKGTLAFDAKLPGDIDFSVEGIYGREFNPAVVTNENRYWDGLSYVVLNDKDVRRKYTTLNSGTECYYITNGGNKAYYYSITAQLAKKFGFGLDLSASYTYSLSKSYGDGIGDQVSSAYYTNRYSVNGINDQELGYGTYVSPHRLLVSASYYKEYGKHFATRVGLMYEGMNMGYAGGYAYTRYSYTFSSCLVGDYGANNLLYIPETREELDDWTFASSTYIDDNGDTQTYTADMQRDDFWEYINQDSYLKNRKGKYTQRGGAVMPWHSQLDFKFEQSFFIKAGKYRNTLQFGVDIKNLANLLNSDWGLYKTVNNTSLLSWSSSSGYTFQKNGSYRLTDTYSKYESFNSTYSIQFSLRYIFN